MSDSLPVKPPKQTRSRRTLERIVAASLAILEEEGASGLTVQAVVARAGSSVGSFYARFEGKEGLIEYLGERVWREAAERWDEALASRDWAGVELPELVEGAVRLLGEAGRSRATFLRTLERSAVGSDDAYLSFQGHIIRGLSDILLSRRADMGHPDPEVAVPLGLRAVLGVLDARRDDEPGAIPYPRRLDEATELLLGYLVPGDRSPREEAGQVDFFDIWG